MKTAPRSDRVVPQHKLEDDASRIQPGPLPRVEWVERHGPALHSAPLADQDDVLGLALGIGCAHRCGFCSVRAHPNFPGDEVVRLYAKTAETLERELSTRLRPPRAVYVSPSTDPFPPLTEVQKEAARVVEVLARRGIDTWLMTRGYIRPAALKVLAAHRKHVKVTIAMTTVDRSIQRILEPLTASPRMRLRQIRWLRDLGINVQVAVEPLLPGVTDTRANLAGLLQAIAESGATRVTAGYMFLRPRIQANLTASLRPHGWDELVLEEYRNGPVLETGGVAPARYLPKARRQRGYAVMMALASELGITVTVSAIANPDFRTPAKTDHKPRQRLLPYFEEAGRPRFLVGSHGPAHGGL